MLVMDALCVEVYRFVVNRRPGGFVFRVAPVPEAVKFFPFDDLSFHTVMLLPENVILLLVLSAPSSHSVELERIIG